MRLWPLMMSDFFHLLQEFLSWTIKAYGNKFLQPVVFGRSQFEEEGSWHNRPTPFTFTFSLTLNHYTKPRLLMPHHTPYSARQMHIIFHSHLVFLDIVLIFHTRICPLLCLSLTNTRWFVAKKICIKKVWPQNRLLLEENVTPHIYSVHNISYDSLTTSNQKSSETINTSDSMWWLCGPSFVFCTIRLYITVLYDVWHHMIFVIDVIVVLQKQLISIWSSLWYKLILGVRQAVVLVVVGDGVGGCANCSFQTQFQLT